MMWSQARAHTTYGIPQCLGMTYSQPRADVIYGHFAGDPDLQVAAVPSWLLSMGPAPRSSDVVTWRNISVHGERAVGYDRRTSWVRESQGHLIVATLRSYLQWAEGGATIEFSSPRQRSLDGLIQVAEGCQVH